MAVLLVAGMGLAQQESKAVQLSEPQEFSTAIVKTTSHTPLEGNSDSATQESDGQDTQTAESDDTEESDEGTGATETEEDTGATEPENTTEPVETDEGTGSTEITDGIEPTDTTEPVETENGTGATDTTDGTETTDVTEPVETENGTGATDTTELVQNQSELQNSVEAKGIFFENTSIIELVNTSTTPVKSFMFWLGSGHSFESFKTESGWTGKKTPEGTIVFTTAEDLDTGESVKFGVKTSGQDLGINWNATDENGVRMGIGKTSPVEKVVQPPPVQIPETPVDGILENSTFRIIPEKPNAGATIRVVGESFGASQHFDFYINSRIVGAFPSDENGNFVATMEIPDGDGNQRVEFVVADANGNEQSVSLRLGIIDSRVPDTKIINLSVHAIPSTLYRGDFLDASGTAQPGSAVTVSIKDSEDVIINTSTAETDSKGDWSLTDPIVIPLDAKFGIYSIEISDGKDSIQQSWEVESSKVIIIEPAKERFEPGDTMTYSGTALPNRPIEFVLEDPLGNELSSEITSTDGSGATSFEYMTSFSSKEGTYTLIATQDKHKEFIFAGLGQKPIIPIDLEFDKLNYRSNETAIISLVGEASDVVKLAIIDPSDQLRPLGTITLGPDGVGKHSLDLARYKSGIYTAVISKGSSESTEIFTVGLRISTGEIKIETTNLDYHPSDSVLILGVTDPNSLLTITLKNPDGNEVRVKDTFSDKNGKISDDTFKIPSDAESGHWTINATSGSHFNTVEINVTTVDQGMVVLVADEENIHGVNYVTIEVIGAAPSQTVIIEIMTSSGEIIDKLKYTATKEGDIKSVWPTSKIKSPGTYTIKVTDAFQEAQTTYEFN
ncbi:MAG: biofilm-associated protein [Thaumarchaeota archaeon]|nr:biofilm-associated protein [Nitrososphaerota archaeon]